MARDCASANAPGATTRLGGGQNSRPQSASPRAARTADRTDVASRPDTTARRLPSRRSVPLVRNRAAASDRRASRPEQDGRAPPSEQPRPRARPRPRRAAWRWSAPDTQPFAAIESTPGRRTSPVDRKRAAAQLPLHRIPSRPPNRPVPITEIGARGVSAGQVVCAAPRVRAIPAIAALFTGEVGPEHLHGRTIR